MMHASISRRDLLRRSALGLGELGLANLLASESLFAANTDPLAAKAPHFAPKAKRVLHIFPSGGPSQVDTFDPKPALTKYHNRPVAEVMADYLKTAPEVATGMGRLSGKLQQSAFKFAKHGKSGLDISELFPKLAAHVDDLCIVRSMSTKSSVHEPAALLMMTGEATQPRPSLGSWAVYGLGTENRNLPAFVAINPGAAGGAGAKTYSAAFLPPHAQATPIRPGASADAMVENLRSGTTSLREQRRQFDLIGELNRGFANRRQDDAFDGRIRSFETAFRMQVEATDAFDLSRETQAIRDEYGANEQGRSLLLARRLLERGVRVVQVFHGGWDTHDQNDERHRDLCRDADQPLAALLADLKRRGLLDDTLVLWGGEFGRTPTSDNNDVAKKKSIGRDHNAGGFTVWMAGGGVKRGHVHGATDDFGAVTVDGRMDVHDLHATMLHLLGFDHEKLTFHYAGRDFRLTDVHGRVVKEILM